MWVYCLTFSTQKYISKMAQNSLLTSLNPKPKQPLKALANIFYFMNMNRRLGENYIGVCKNRNE